MMRSPYFKSKTVRTPEIALEWMNTLIFPKTFIIRDGMAGLIFKEKIKSQVADLIEGYCRLMETHAATLENAKISMDEKMRYLEEIYEKHHLKFLLNLFKSSKDSKKGLIESLIENAQKLINKLRDQLLKEIHYYDYDQLYVTIRGLLNGEKANAQIRKQMSASKSKHTKFYGELLEEAYSIVRPHCKEMDNFCSRHFKTIHFIPPSTFNDLDDTLDKLCKTLERKNLKKISLVFTEQFKDIFKKLEPDQETDLHFGSVTEATEDLVSRINSYLEAFELKKILHHFIENLDEYTLSPHEKAQKVFYELLNQMIESMIVHKASLRGRPEKKYISRFPSEDEWGQFLEKVKDLKPAPHFAKKVFEETVDKKTMESMDALSIDLEPEEEERPDNSASSSITPNTNLYSSFSSTSCAHMSKAQIQSRATARSLIETKTDESYIALIKRRLGHAKKLFVYTTMFDTSAKCTLTWDDLIKCIQSFEGYIDNCGSATGSGSKVILPSVLTPADELKPSKMESRCFFHWPHGKRSLNDIVHRGILEEFKAGFVAAGLTPNKFGIEIIAEEKEAKKSKNR